MKALMIDNETLGLTPTSLVHQIGFCAADLRTGEYLIPPTNLFIADTCSGMVDFETVCWWMRQSDEARKTVFPEEAMRITPVSAYIALKHAYESLGVDEDGTPATVWASPAMFDLPQLVELFWRSGAVLRPGDRPWPYYMERDLMTLYKMLDKDKTLKPSNPVEHDAASDAKAQMDHLIAIFKNNPHLA